MDCEGTDANMDWEAIQNVLRSTHKESDYLGDNPGILPLSELTHYKNVQNLTQPKFARLSNKEALDKDSTRLCLRYLADEGYYVLSVTRIIT